MAERGLQPRPQRYEWPTQLLEKGETGHRYESISIPKRPYAEWFREQAEEVQIHMSDPELREAIIERYPRL